MSFDRPAIFVAVETTAFSGATLLTNLLGAHPSIATVAEMSGLIDGVNPDEYLCSCGQKIKVCSFWQSVKKGMNERGFEFEIENFNTQFVSGRSFFSRLREGSSRIRLIDSIRDSVLFSLPSQVRYFQAMADRNRAFIETILEITGKRAFVDSSKDRLRPKALRRFSSLDVRIVHLVRDVRGVVASQLRRDKDVTAAQAARAWRQRHHRVAITLASWAKEKQMVVRYEDLCRDPEATLKQIYSFCEVDPDCKITNYQDLPHHLIGNPMRLTRVSKIEPDERWKEELTSTQLKDIELIAGSVGRQYHYFMQEETN